MGELLEFGFRAALIRTGATLTMDLWSILLKHGLGVRTLDYGMVGRWSCWPRYPPERRL
ncbi:DUF2938 family protein [Microvirga subterranea]|uniref:DUF2938 family protein n=1 Tax=Microvirga subterranea TaxID=186651 RepID=UPI000E0B74FD